MKKCRITWSKRALKNFNRILIYITRKESIARANYVGNEILNTIENISLFPAKHGIDPRINNPDIRFSMKWKFKILFRIEEENVRILDIVHTAQRPERLTY